jgi:hypothetical protein
MRRTQRGETREGWHESKRYGEDGSETQQHRQECPCHWGVRIHRVLFFGGEVFLVDGGHDDIVGVNHFG